MTLNIGEIYTSNNCGDMEVIEYVDSRKVRIRFRATGFEKYTQESIVREGGIRDPYLPVVYSIGYTGVGTYKSKVDGNGTKVYSAWHSMLQRCYVKHSNPTYTGCTVVKEWHNFQVFAKWFEENYIEEYHLDKDIKVPGNKVYGPDTCIFVTQAENTEAARAVSAVFYNPEGEKVEVYNISKFARDNGLLQSSLSDVKNGDRKHHRGWTLYKEGGSWKKVVLTIVFRSPEGEAIEVELGDIAKFAREMGLCNSALTKVKNGKQGHHKGWTLYKEGTWIEPASTTAVFKSPVGEIVEVQNFTKFARDNGLNRNALAKVKNGKQGHHKGWTLWKEGGSVIWL